MKTMKKSILMSMFLTGIKIMACAIPSPVFYNIENNKLYWIIEASMYTNREKKLVKEVDFKTLKAITEDGKEISLNNFPLNGKEISLNNIPFNNKIVYDFIKDKNNVYYQGKKINGADSKTFKALRNNYFKDKNNIYEVISYTKTISGSSQETTSNSRENEPVIPVPGACVLQVISFIKKINGADPNTFEILNNGYSKDKNNVYHKGEKINGANPKTFKVNNSVEAEN